MDPPSDKRRKLHAPGRDEPAKRPAVDDRLAPPETRLEYLRGNEIFAAPADPPHATQHFDLTYVLGAHVKKGYRGAVDMLTRTSEVTDVAPDASVFAASPDPKTGGRRLEEIAFEVSDKQAISVPTMKARDLVARGVRRVFCILVKQRRVLEWSREVDGWQTMPKGAVIEDPCLVRPIGVDSLLDAASADEAVARALLAKKNPVLEEALAEKEAAGEAAGRAAGEAAGRAAGEAAGAAGLRRAILATLESRGLDVAVKHRKQIAGCDDLATLERWLGAALRVKRAAEVFAPKKR